ncbi:hypothetical protein [Streptomyces sp. NRRL S-31]|uniref:hypothetical protein n=1 Tax=Streptomyces sp. NRRL S-31 TaxID=1463898 RepID=UPI0004C6A630|nr:hypothetical protein [Streptomyces sp. NRRL S-31]
MCCRARHTGQHDAYGQELARVTHHQHKAAAARFTVFQALAAAGIGHEQADDIMSRVEAGAARPRRLHALLVARLRQPFDPGLG